MDVQDEPVLQCQRVAPGSGEEAEEPLPTASRVPDCGVVQLFGLLPRVAFPAAAASARPRQVPVTMEIRVSIILTHGSHVFNFKLILDAEHV